MKILQISPQVPYPLSDGGKVGIFNLTKYLARRGHTITLVCLDVHNPPDVRPLEEYCHLIRVPHSKRNSILAAVGNLPSEIPYNVAKYRSPDLEVALKNLLAREHFDVVHVDHLHMAHYGLLCRQLTGIPVVLREHNVESVIMERFHSVTRSYVLRVWLDRQLRRMRRYEASMAGMFDACCCVTRRDLQVLNSLQPGARGFVVPVGVENRYFALSNPRKVPNSLAVVGDFSWAPSRDALDWFVGNIFPRVLEYNPDAEAYLIGSNVPLTSGKRIIRRGTVPDFKEELTRYQMLVVPQRVGGGVRMKILESFAMGVPVVSTSVGREGIGGVHGKHLLVADSEEDLVGNIVRLFSDIRLRRTLMNNARALVRKTYRWELSARMLEGVYKKAIAYRRPPQKARRP